MKFRMVQKKYKESPSSIEAFEEKQLGEWIETLQNDK